MSIMTKFLLLVISVTSSVSTQAFTTPSIAFVGQRRFPAPLFAENKVLQRVPAELENTPIPFIESDSSSFIECYADSIVTVDNVEYTIGTPCDYSVAICCKDEETDELVPVELDDPLLDDVFPICESIVADEFGEELVLQRTPQTLTLVGELDEDDEDEIEDWNMDDEDEEDEEEVEVMLTFDFRDQEFLLVRLLDPILLVGKVLPGDGNQGSRVLLTPQESSEIMPILEELFLEFHEDPDDTLL